MSEETPSLAEDEPHRGSIPIPVLGRSRSILTWRAAPILRILAAAVYRLVLSAVLVAAVGAGTAAGVQGAPRHVPRNMSWHGGPVQRHPRVYIIFWGSRWSGGGGPRAVKGIAVRTIQALRGSSYQHVLTQYYDRAGHITGDVRLSGVWVDRTTPRRDLIAGNRGIHQAAEEVARAVRVNGWRNSLDAQYLLMVPAPEKSPGPAVYCARNVNRSLRGEVFVFSIFPWLGPGGRGCGGHSLDQAYESTVSHEYSEMVTDPLANAWARGDPAGHNHEIADLCGGGAKVRGLWLQKIWSNRLRGCAA